MAIMDDPIVPMRGTEAEITSRGELATITGVNGVYAADHIVETLPTPRGVLELSTDKLLWLLFEGHAIRCADLTADVCAGMGLYNTIEFQKVRIGALLHDIGKMHLHDRILSKPGALTPDERRLMQFHCEWGGKMIESIDHLSKVAVIAWAHHERWDGTGYPRGLKGTDIPLIARAFAPVDVLDALMTERPYRKAMSEHDAWQIVESGAGTHFDPSAVAALRYAYRKLKANVFIPHTDT